MDVSVEDGLLPENASFEPATVIRFTNNLSFNDLTADYKTVSETNTAKDRTVFVVNAASFAEFLHHFDW